MSTVPPIRFHEERGFRVKRSSLLVISVLVLGLLLAGVLAGCGSTSDEATTTVPSEATTTTGAVSTDTTVAVTTTLSAGDTGVDYPNIIFSTLKGLGKGEVDAEAWRNSEAGQKMVEESRNGFLYKNEMDPAVLAYWDALGMKKEMHDGADPLLKWASYTPVVALAADNTAVYPVVFDFVGGEKLIFSAEGHGLAHLGAKKGFITVCPANPVSNDSEAITPGGQVVRILDALEAGGYPIDRSRVYVCGMSAGGVATSMTGLEFPQVVAAVAMHSSLAVLNTAEGGSPPFFTPPSDYAKAMDYGLPMMAVAGDHDFSQLPIKTAGIIDGLNLWLQVNDCPTQLTLEGSLDAQATSTDPAVKQTGIVGDKNWTKTIGGAVYDGAEYYRADGVKMVEVVCVENLPHWMSPGFAELAWDFMSRFSRGADGQLIVAQ
jgi:poly(3-hydroxybutyrate) depolymerase